MIQTEQVGQFNLKNSQRCVKDNPKAWATSKYLKKIPPKIRSYVDTKRSNL